MKYRKWYILLPAAAVLAVAGVLLSRSWSEKPLRSFHYTFNTMGTLAQCTFFTDTPERAGAAFEAVKREFARVNFECNHRNPASGLFRLNNTPSGTWVSLSPLLWAIMSECRIAFAESCGAFDVSIKPLMDCRGFYRRRNAVPGPDEISAVMKQIGMDKIEWDDRGRRMRFTVPGMAIDLGGVAKGYALDLAAAEVVKLGVKSGVIDLGGNLWLLPEPPPGKDAYTIGIRSPSGEGDSKEVLTLPGNCAVSTSGSYERYVTLGGRRYGHVVDPVTGDAPYRDWSVTVATPTGVFSDWLSSALFLRGKALAEQVERKHPAVKVFFTSAGESGDERKQPQ